MLQILVEYKLKIILLGDRGLFNTMQIIPIFDQHLELGFTGTPEMPKWKN